MESNDAKALPDPSGAVAGEDRALFPRPYFALYHFQGGGGGGGKSDGSKTNFTLMEKLFNIPRLREGDEGRGRERGREGTGCSSSGRMEARDQGCQLHGWVRMLFQQMSDFIELNPNKILIHV